MGQQCCIGAKLPPVSGSGCLGQSTAEYIIIALVVAVAVIASVQTFGRSIACNFTDASGRLRHVSDRNGRSGCAAETVNPPLDDDEKPPIHSYFSGQGGPPQSGDDEKPPQSSHFSSSTTVNSTSAPSTTTASTSSTSQSTSIQPSSTCYLNFLKADCHWNKDETSGVEGCKLGVVYVEELACSAKFTLNANTRKAYQKFCEAIGDKSACLANKPPPYSEPTESSFCTGLCG